MYTRFDIIEGWYFYCLHFYVGQGDWLYERLCRISKYYRPGLNQTMPTGAAREVYDSIFMGHM